MVYCPILDRASAGSYEGDAFKTWSQRHDEYAGIAGGATCGPLWRSRSRYATRIPMRSSLSWLGASDNGCGTKL